MDEATSALDVRTERALADAMQELMKGAANFNGKGMEQRCENFITTRHLQVAVASHRITSSSYSKLSRPLANLGLLMLNFRIR